MKHTPGPWFVEQGKKADELFVGNSPGHGRVCRLWNGRTCRDANARLIAAAPELLEACKQIVSALKSDGPMDTEALKSAIAKAEGVAPANGTVRRVRAPQLPAGGVRVSDIIQRLKDACVGHPYAKIPWPHRLLHDAISEIELLRRRPQHEEQKARQQRSETMSTTGNQRPRTMSAEREAELYERVMLRDRNEPSAFELFVELDAECAVSDALLAALKEISQIGFAAENNYSVAWQIATDAIALAEGRHAD